MWLLVWPMVGQSLVVTIMVAVEVIWRSAENHRRGIHGIAVAANVWIMTKENKTGGLNTCKLLVDALTEAKDIEAAMELANEFHNHPSMVAARNDGGGGGYKRKWGDD